MFVKKNSCKNGRILLTMTHTYRENGKIKQKHLEALGYLDELEKTYTDPIAHFREIAQARTLEESRKSEPIKIEINPNTKISESETGIKNLGYAVFEKLYHQLGIHTFFQRHENRLNIEFNLNSIFRLLVYSRIIDPGSKQQAFDHQKQFFEPLAHSLESVYRSLDYFDQMNLELQAWMFKEIQGIYGRSLNYAYYDVTNYFFEIDEEDSLRRKGPSKEHRPNPIVQMGLLLDSRGIPLSYHLFAGNQSEKLSLNPFIDQIQQNNQIGRMIVVADKGLNCGDNVAFQLARGNGYIYSQSIRGADQEFKDYVLAQTGYAKTGEHSQCKSRIYPKEISFTDKNKKKKKMRVDQRQVVFFSQDYADKARYERNRTITKALRYLKSPTTYSKSLPYSAASYIKGIQISEDGEILDSTTKLYLDEEKIREEEKYDGYYAIVSSELNLRDEEIIDIYHGLWKIEETFKISKSELRTRPIYVSLEAHIEAHFLSCFVALVLIRILELKMNNAKLPDNREGSLPGEAYSFSSFSLLESLRKYTFSHVSENIYNFHHYDDNIHAIEKVFDICLDKKYRTRGEIRKFVASMKK